MSQIKSYVLCQKISSVANRWLNHRGNAALQMGGIHHQVSEAAKDSKRATGELPLRYRTLSSTSGWPEEVSWPTLSCPRIVRRGYSQVLDIAS